MYGMFFKDCVTVGGNPAFICFSDAVTNILVDVTEVSFDGTYHTVPKQFYQVYAIQTWGQALSKGLKSKPKALSEGLKPKPFF